MAFTYLVLSFNIANIPRSTKPLHLLLNHQRADGAGPGSHHKKSSRSVLYLIDQELRVVHARWKSCKHRSQSPVNQTHNYINIFSAYCLEKFKFYFVCLFLFVFFFFCYFSWTMTFNLSEFWISEYCSTSTNSSKSLSNL